MCKTHAKDYLTEFATSQANWMKILIKEVIDTNGIVSKERLDEIFEGFIKDSSISEPIPTVPATNVSKQKVLFKTLKHISGVGALSENQEIKFSDSVTVLYGLNGSGKSSYFRILNELCGGNQKKEILQNIYEDSEKLKPIKVSGNYKIGNTDKSINDWNPQKGALPDLQSVKVFDSSYLMGLLSPRTPDETVVYPLGIHLFSYLSNVLDYYSKTDKRHCDIKNKLLSALVHARGKGVPKSRVICAEFAPLSAKFTNDSYQIHAQIQQQSRANSATITNKSRRNHA